MPILVSVYKDSKNSRRLHMLSYGCGFRNPAVLELDNGTRKSACNPGEHTAG